MSDVAKQRIRDIKQQGAVGSKVFTRAYSVLVVVAIVVVCIFAGYHQYSAAAMVGFIGSYFLGAAVTSKLVGDHYVG